MKTIFRTMLIAGAVVMAAGCGSNTKKAEAQPEAVVETVPTVSVVQVSKREVPQIATYTSTVQPYVKNNIVPQAGGRITKINVEIGDFVKAGQVLAEIDKYCMPSIRTTVELKTAALGDDSNIYGSLAMIHEAEGTDSSYRS
jgi:glucokinase